MRIKGKNSLSSRTKNMKGNRVHLNLQAAYKLLTPHFRFSPCLTKATLNPCIRCILVPTHNFTRSCTKQLSQGEQITHIPFFVMLRCERQ